ncbi:nitroreductase [Alcaligenaceae bacterium]|nr:nitroreductase [Alcaligenaceae bacterium]
MNEFDIVSKAITSRRSVRGFLPDPIDISLINQILSAASFAPSGSNIQPWKVHVVMGEKRDELSQQLLEAFSNQLPETREYQYYPVEWRSPYIERRRETGWGLYRTMGIQKGDRVASAQQHGRNFAFFDAPVVLIFTIDNYLQQGSWLDYGMFLQSIMVSARGLGLHTCPQAALANYAAIVKNHLGIADDQTVICGISMGYEDTSCVANQYRPDRMELNDFVTVHS